MNTNYLAVSPYSPYSRFYMRNVPETVREKVFKLCERKAFRDALRLLHDCGYPEYDDDSVRSFYYHSLQTPPPPPQPEPENPNALPASNGNAPKRRDKMARLPRDIRDEVNTMLDNGATYDQIIQWLAKKGHPGFNKSNLSRWQHGAFQDWLRETERRDAHVLNREWLLDRVADVKPDELLPLLDQLFVTEFLDAVVGLDTAALKQRLASSPRDFIALFNAYRRLKRDLTGGQDQPHPKNPDDPLRVVTPGCA